MRCPCVNRGKEASVVRNNTSFENALKALNWILAAMLEIIFPVPRFFSIHEIVFLLPTFKKKSKNNSHNKINDFKVHEMTTLVHVWFLVLLIVILSLKIFAHD